MNRGDIRINTLMLTLSILTLGFMAPLVAQEPAKKEAKKEAAPVTREREQETQINRPPQVSLMTLTARLVDPENKAKKKAATVEVSVSGLELIDPAQTGELPKTGQGHIHYQVDDGPVIATTTTKLSFHGLSSGPHKIVVMLAGNDHKPLGPSQTLNVTIP